ncbi:MAG: hypothetical protein RL427_1354 [Bacteroidota bacterium]|jgi:peptidoglycan/LPS O-acetylase OafA/YrhL
MNKTFKGDFVPFYLRLFKRLAPIFLLMFFLYFKVTYSHTFEGFRNYFYVFMPQLRIEFNRNAPQRSPDFAEYYYYF